MWEDDGCLQVSEVLSYGKGSIIPQGSLRGWSSTQWQELQQAISGQRQNTDCLLVYWPFQPSVRKHFLTEWGKKKMSEFPVTWRIQAKIVTSLIGHYRRDSSSRSVVFGMIPAFWDEVLCKMERSDYITSRFLLTCKLFWFCIGVITFGCLFQIYLISVFYHLKYITLFLIELI